MISDSDKMNMIIDFSKMALFAMSKKYNLNYTHCQAVKGGRQKMSKNMIISIARALPEINPRWLLLGEGDMIVKGKK